MIKRTTLILSVIFFITISLGLSTTYTVYQSTLATYAQTNAAAIATTINNNTTSNTTASNDGLQIKKDVRYFDSASGYLVYPSTATSGTTGEKLPAVIMIHEWWGINDNIRDYGKHTC